jgi:hypothetical protein
VKLFEKKYRVESKRTGRGLEEWTHRTLVMAALQAARFDYIEMHTGGTDTWIVVGKYPRRKSAVRNQDA